MLCILDKSGLTKAQKMDISQISDCYILGNGKLLMNPFEIFHSKRKGVAVKMDEAIYRGPSLNDIDSESFFVQNYPSMVVAHVLQPQSGEKILDMCAAPGKKNFHFNSIFRRKDYPYLYIDEK